MRGQTFWALVLAILSAYLTGVVEGNKTRPATRPQSLKHHRNGLYYANYDTTYQASQLPVADLSHVFYGFASLSTDGTVSSSNAAVDTGAQLDFAANMFSEASQRGRQLLPFKRQIGFNVTNSTSSSSTMTSTTTSSATPSPTASNNTVASGAVGQLFSFKTQQRNLKIMLSIGGGSADTAYTACASTEETRNNFAASAVQMTMNFGMDGVDLDWEYPSNATDAANYVSLLQTLRNAYDDFSFTNNIRYRFLISVAISAKSSNYNQFDIPGMDPYVDVWNLLAYDYSGAASAVATHQSNVFPGGATTYAASNVFASDVITYADTDTALQFYIGQGIAPAKIQLGIPMYGRSFENTAGLGQPFSGVGPGGVRTDGTQGAGVWYYNQLPKAGADELYDDVAQAAYSYDGTAREFITYDDVASVEYKASYLRRLGLGGAFFFEARGDRTGDGSLVTTMQQALGALDNSRNNLDYPTSQYSNIRDASLALKKKDARRRH